MLKTLDRYILKSFIPPLLMTFAIALFVLIMQFFWKYVDDIIGKGLDLLIIGELVFYLSMTLVPMALPIAVLISSVMVMGNMGERYELSSMKSAGMPLWRIMMPLIISCAILGVTSFLIGNYVIPYSNLKFQSRLHDIRKQKPTLSLQEGVFNDDFKGYAIRIGKKGSDNRSIQDVLIYDHSNERRNERIQVIAKEGEMYTTKDRSYMILELNNGKQYQEVSSNGSSDGNYPFVRTNFEKWEKIFDMSEFNMSRTDEQLFSNHYQTMTGSDILRAIDSLEIKLDNYAETLAQNTKPYFQFRKRTDTIYTYEPLDTTGLSFTATEDFITNIDVRKQETTRQKAITLATRLKEYAYSAEAGMERTQQSIVEHWVWFHRKISFALACFIFIFIGAPMGAIIRKGGFGWPMLIAIFFFMTFIVLFMTGEKLAKEQVVAPHIGIYLPIFILFPLGIFLTYKAMTDSKILDMDSYTGFFKRIAKRFNQRQTSTKHNDSQQQRSS